MQVLTLATLSESVATGPDLTRYFTVVGLMVAVLMAVAYGLKRIAAKTGRLGRDRKGLTMVEVLPLGGRRQVAIVRCYDRTFALGLGEKDVSLIAELDPITPPQPVTAETPGAASVPAPVPATRDRFEEMIGRAQERLATNKNPDQHDPTTIQEMV
ncbi:MAG: flagellar biogenesis protein FliO [Planctomycetota bacterium]|jgi:flagellar biogenesis protein FliO